MKRLILTMLVLIVPATGPAAASSDDGWSPTPFAYERPRKLEIRSTDRKIDYTLMKSDQKLWTFTNKRGDTVSVLVTLPERAHGPLPVVVLVHGFADDSQHVTRRIGRQLVDAGFACVAPDLPMHGQRSGVPKDVFEDKLENVLEHFTQGVIDIRQTIDFAETRKELDTTRGVMLLGYSTGTWHATLAGAADQRVRAMVLLSAGATAIDPRKSDTGAHGLLYRYPEVRPTEAICHFASRPLLMVNGRRDPLVPEAQVRRLFSAAGSPRELRWYDDAGHLLPTEANEEVARWLTRRWKEIRKTARSEPATAPARKAQ